MCPMASFPSPRLCCLLLLERSWPMCFARPLFYVTKPPAEAPLSVRVGSAPMSQDPMAVPGCHPCLDRHRTTHQGSLLTHMCPLSSCCHF
jgi:hypothetical protein